MPPKLVLRTSHREAPIPLADGMGIIFFSCSSYRERQATLLTSLRRIPINPVSQVRPLRSHKLSFTPPPFLCNHWLGRLPHPVMGTFHAAVATHQESYHFLFRTATAIFSIAEKYSVRSLFRMAGINHSANHHPSPKHRRTTVSAPFTHAQAVIIGRQYSQIPSTTPTTPSTLPNAEVSWNSP